MPDNKTIVKNFLAALGRGDVDALRGLLSEDAVAICTGTSLVSGTRSYAEICATAGMLGAIARSGIDFEILSMTAEDDRVSCEVQGHATLINGAAYDNQYHFLFFVRGGRIFRIKEYIDTKLADAVLAPLLQSLASQQAQ